MKSIVLGMLTVLGVLSAQAFTMKLTLGAGGSTAEIQAEVTDLDLQQNSVGTTSPGATNIVAGELYDLSATAAAGYEFAGWVVAPGSNLVAIVDPTVPDTTMTVTNLAGNITVKATFRTPSVKLIVSSDGHQSAISPALGTNYVTMGSTQTLNAAAASGYRFLDWEDPAVPGNPSGNVAAPSNAVTTITMNQNYAVKAVFKQTCTVTQHNPQGPGSGDFVVGPLDLGSKPTISTSQTVPNEPAPNKQYFCTGWTNAGPDLKAYGFGFVCTYSNAAGLSANNQVTWTWKTQDLVTVNLGGTGAGMINSVSNSPYTVWVDDIGPSTVVQLSATALPVGAVTSHFAGWTLPAGMTLATGETLLLATIHVTLNGVTLPIQATFNLDAAIGNNGLPVDWDRIVGLNPDAAIDDPISGKNADPDGDGLSNFQEYSMMFSNASVGAIYCDPLNWDSDGDGMDDKWERDVFSSDAQFKVGTQVPPWLDGGTFAAKARYGADGDPSSVYLWDTTTGYEMKNQPLTNLKRYVGPDGQAPYTTLAVPPGGTYVNYMRTTTRTATVLVNNLGRTIFFAQPNALDTKDQSLPLADPVLGTMNDNIDDGFKYSWDQWQMNDTAVAGASSYLADIIHWSGITQRVENVTGAWSVYRPFKPNVASGAVGNLGEGYYYNPVNGRIVAGPGVTASEAYQASILHGAASGATYPVIRSPVPALTTGKWCTNPFLWDTDKDGLPDGWELTFGYDPWSRDTGTTGTTDDMKDPLHKTYASAGQLRNHAVRLANGFNPQTPLHDPADWTKLGPNTAYYTYYQEILCDNLAYVTGVPVPGSDSLVNLAGMTLANQTTLNGTGWRTTNPHTLDSDGDGMYDGWEMYVGLDPLNPLDRSGDLAYDDDGLINFDEFDSHWTPPGGSNANYYVANWFNKAFPTDPFDPDTDGDQLYDGQERTLFNNAPVQNVYTAIVTTVAVGAFTSVVTVAANGGLCPTTVDTDGDKMPDNWEAFYGGTRMPNPPVNGTIADAMLDGDNDGLLNYQEYMTGFVYMWQFQHTDPRLYPQPADYTPESYGTYMPGLGFGGYEPYDFIATSNSAALYGGFSDANQFGLQPRAWDPHYWAISPLIRYPVPYTFLAGFIDRPVVSLPQFATTDPGLKDTDADGMDDYWEVYHGINPLFGNIDVVRSSLDTIANSPDAYALAADTTLDQFDAPVIPQPADLRLYPWISGYPLTDADQDGLPNLDESLQANSTEPPAYHTDPSPLWMTDISSTESWVNQHYWLGNVMGAVGGGGWWFWDLGVMADPTQLVDPAPTYMFNFEMNEGFDTDHDNLADRAELVSDPAVKPGVTDPIDDMSPPKRRALHLDGVNSAARTVTSYPVAANVLQQFTIETWVRPEAGNAGKQQTLLERPGLFPQGNSDLEAASLLVNYRLALDESGVPFVAYNGKERPFLYVMAKAPAYYALHQNTWYHLAATYGGATNLEGQWVGHLKLYINGQVAADVPSSEIPANGFIGASGLIPGTTVVTATLIPMPNVTGASDQNPNALIYGLPTYGLVGAPAGMLYLLGAPVFTNYFHGWLDQIRIWDGPRTQAQIQSLMKARHTRQDIVNLSQTQALLFAYTFDNLPDPNFEGIEPAGFNDVMGRPAGYNSSPWWGGAATRSLWYTDYNNYRCIPWIVDEVSHNPENEPFDSTIAQVMAAFNNGWMKIPVTTNVFPNASNPYGMFYVTATSEAQESYPFLGGPGLAGWGAIPGFSVGPLYPDMLPCGYALADENLPMWDDNSNPASTYSDRGDMDGDGLPDWWEIAYGLDYLDPTGVNGANGDPDGDGLSNLYEYWSGGDPNVAYSLDPSGNLTDFEWDSDHDGLCNGLEQLYGTRPDLPDTDDNGMSDGFKIKYGIDPRNALLPAVARALAVNGANYVAAPDGDVRFATKTFDITVWVSPTAVPATNSIILARELDSGVFNYCLALDNQMRPFFQLTDGNDTNTLVRLSGSGADTIPLNAWSKLRATFSDSTGKMQLYLNDVAIATTTISIRPPTAGNAVATLHVGAGFIGYIDDVLISSNGVNLLSYLFDDGTSGINGTDNDPSMIGTSGDPLRTTGQVQDFAARSDDWMADWVHAGTLVNGAQIVDLTADHGDVIALDRYGKSSLDSDGDGLPDWWEIKYGLNPFAVDSFNDGISDANRDMVGDGVKNYFKYLAKLDPTNPENTPGTPNGALLFGGLTLLEKQQYNLDPLRDDTDDDGLSDFMEVKGNKPSFTLGNASLSPAKAGALQITGSGQYVDMPNQARIALNDSWTVEAWICISSNFSGTGSVIKRQVGSMVNYDLGFAGGYPYIRCVGLYGTNTYPFQATGATVLNRRNQWYHLAGVYDKAAGQIKLLVDGSIVATANVLAYPSLATGAGVVTARVGEGFLGYIDEVRIWNTAEAVADIAQNAYQTFENVPLGPALYYRFDDGPFGVTATTTNAYGLTINTVEDFGSPAGDWQKNWSHAGSLHGASMTTNLPARSPIPATAFVDQDADGLPDFWEIAAFGSITSHTGTDDPSGGGLNNYYKYRAHLDPLVVSTFNDGITDGDRDADADGLTNLKEQQLGTMPDMIDTDDDGVPDGVEYGGGMNPVTGKHQGITDALNSMNPLVPRALALNGNSRVVVESQARHAMTNAWTLAAWVWPSNNASGVVVARTMSDNSVNYELGVTNNNGKLLPYVRYTGLTNGQPCDVRVEAGVAGMTYNNNTNRFGWIVPQSWTHVAGTFQAASNTLTLYVGGEAVAWRTDATLAPVVGSGPGLPLGGELSIGGGRRTLPGNGVANGLSGYLDDVRIAAEAYGPVQIKQMANGQQVSFTSTNGTTNATGSVSSSALASRAALPSKVGELIVGLRPGTDAATMAAALPQAGVQILHRFSIIPAFHVKITDGMDQSAKIAALQADKRIAYVEPNYKLTLFDTLPNDARFGEQWGLHNSGTNYPGGGVAGADIHAPAAWDISKGKKSVIVAVIDTGIDYTHEDIKGNIWVNPGEIPNNGIDDDGNGYIDDVYGYDFADNRSDPMPDPAAMAGPETGHGTHCAGIIGATGNNGIGVCGVNWNVSLMALKISDTNGVIGLDAAIAAINYAWKMGARVSNASWGGYGYSQALYDAIKVAGQNDNIFCAAAANDSNDNDQLPAYPASFDLDNIISVAATDNRDDLAWFSNYGAKTVDLGAPGVAILSTLPGNTYQAWDGTSMATPMVAGSAGLVLSVDSRLSAAAVKAAILNNVDPDPALAGKCVTGGRLNVGNILPKMGGAAGVTIANGQVGWFKFWDGGKTVQDFTLIKDWLTDWRYAGVLEGGAAMTTNVVYLPMASTPNDGIPDWWRLAYGLDPYNANGDSAATGDPDGDGLNNLYEYLAGTNPLQPDSEGLGVSDYDRDSDGDGISNGREQDVTLTNPGDPDTDDDFALDGQELANNTKPGDSSSPFVLRALNFSGSANVGANVVTFQDKVNNTFTSRHSAKQWTIETYVNLATNEPAGSYPLISRRTYADGSRNYELGISGGVPYVAFDAGPGQAVVLTAANTNALTPGRWTHLAGRFTLNSDGSGNELALFVDGVKVVTSHTALLPATAPGDLVFGSTGGFVGMLSNVRIWKIPQDDAAIASMLSNTLLYGSVNAMAGRLNLTGTGHLKETATTVKANGEYIDVLRQNWTLECWVKTTATGGSLIERRNQSDTTPDNFNYYLGLTPTGTLLGRFAMDYSYFVYTIVNGNVIVSVVYVRDFNLNNITGEIPVNDGAWHHVAYVRADSGCYLYVDGKLDVSQSRLVMSPTIPIDTYDQFPAVYAQPGPCIFGENLTGEMDEIRIWNRALGSTELADVSSRNLSGTESGLISYFNFDFQLGTTADERSILRNPDSEYGIYIPNASNLNGSNGSVPITYSQLLALERVELIGMIPCSDGGKTVEDYLYRQGVSPFNFGPYAGQFGGGVSWLPLSATNYPFSVDSDGDGLPDWWEIQYGLNPSDASGDNGAFGDPDHDGLDNMAEYLAGTDPRNPNSTSPSNSVGAAAGYFDYDHRASSNSLTFGELYSPMDGIPALWKSLNGLNPNVYVADDDPDGDGWSNYAEYMAGTSPVDGADVPHPSVTFNVWYAGAQGTGPLVVQSFVRPAMDGVPNATFVCNASSNSVYPVSFNTADASNVTVTGWLHEGDNYFFAFSDLNNNGLWDAGEPCGYAVYQPLYVSWSGLSVDISLQDAPELFPRIQWALPAGVVQSRIRLDWAQLSSQSTNAVLTSFTTILDMTLQAPKNYITEADVVRYAGANANIKGLYEPSGASFRQQPVYRWSVDFDPLDPTTGAAATFAADTPTNTFVTMQWTAMTGDQPTLVYPNNETVQSMPVRLEWQEDTDKIPAFQVDIVQGTTAGPSVFSAAVRAPYTRDSNGMYHYVFYPQYWTTQFLTLLDGTYYWRVTPVNNASITTTASAWSRMLINASGAMLPPYTNSATGPFSITGHVDYAGKVANHAISEWVTHGTGAAKTLSGTLAFKPVTPGSLTLAVIRSNANTWVTFSDANANFANPSSVMLTGVSTYAGWQMTTATVNYTTGSFSMTFTNTPATNDIVLATYDYQGYPFVVQAYPVSDVAGFSGKPVAQTNLWKKGQFTLYGLQPENYVLLGFIDQNGNGRRDKTEAWGFVRNAVPASGAGNPEIRQLSVGPSITAAKGVSVLLRDVDTDNDKLPDAWEVQKFGSVGAYSGDQSLNGDSTIWQTYANGPLDDDPRLTDSNFDGVPDVIANALGFNAHDIATFSQMDAYLTGYTNTLFSIPVMKTDAAGNPMLKWHSPAVDSSWNYQIVYTVQRTASLGSSWSTVGYVIVPSGAAAQEQTWVDRPTSTNAAARSSFYRLQVGITRPMAMPSY